MYFSDEALHRISMLNISKTDIERISDICSNVGVSTVMRLAPAKGANVHEYISFLHSGRDEEFNTRYQQLHDDYFSRLDALQKNA